MKSRIVKFDKNYIFSFIENCYGGFMLSKYESERKNLIDGRVIFSLKVNKRRKLIKGMVNTDMESSKEFGRHEVFYFTPNNRAKFFSFFRTEQSNHA